MAELSEAEKKAFEYRDRAAKLWEDLQLPTFDTSAYTSYATPETLTLGQYASPDTLTVQNWDPVIGGYESISVDPAGREAQNDVMADLRAMAETGYSTADRVQAQGITDQMMRARQTQDRALMRDLAARGQLGSGAELAARMMANDSAMDAANDAGSKLAAEGMARKLQAMGMSGQIAGQQAGQDIAVAGKQADIVNAFNNRKSVLGTQAAAANAQTQNQANVFNLQNKQAVAQRNIDTQNQQNLFNLQNKQNIAVNNTNLANASKDKKNAYTQQDMGNKLSKLQGQGNAYLSQAAGLDTAAAAANANKAASDANTLGWINAGVKLAGNADKIVSGVEKAAEWFGSGGGDAAVEGTGWLLADGGLVDEDDLFARFLAGRVVA